MTPAQRAATAATSSTTAKKNEYGTRYWLDYLPCMWIY